ncbi:hypothetical protein QBC37DRAFT_155432 [Rhypophila decipiens]|uniref:Uncharacterized protein n=1 Tax=Rhypophila decipiens TaxID=261697 RepID=A0AAN7B6C8_9PEZI|nr:hypothetical protein QBC37DRAFT_155432 [Rhypophila decipiens]
MAPRYLTAALALAVQSYIRTGAASLLSGRINNHAVANVIAAATTTDAGLMACATADAITSSCYVAGSFDLDVPVETIQQCLCCYSSVELDEIYLSCASYIAYSEPGLTEAFSIATSLYDICDLTGTCPVIDLGDPAPPPPDPTTPTTTPPSPPPPPETPPPAEPTPTAPPPPEVTGPVVCTSLAIVFQACSSAIPGFASAPVSELADCFCYDNTGKYNTDVQDWADGCEPWAKTAAPSDLEVIQVFQTFCDVYALPPTPTEPAPGPRPTVTTTTTKPKLTLTPTTANPNENTDKTGDGPATVATNTAPPAVGLGSAFGSGGFSKPTSTPGALGDGESAGPSSSIVVTVTQTPPPRPNSNVAGLGMERPQWGVLGLLGLSVVAVVFWQF